MENNFDLMSGSTQSSDQIMNGPSPTPMDYESISSSETIAEHEDPTCHPGCTPQDSGISPLEGTWRRAHTLKNHDNVKLESPTAPVLTFWHGQIWLSYRTTGNRILLGVRTTNEPNTNQYQEYDLSADKRARAKSDQPPTIAGYGDYLYIAWKSERPNTGIWYQRTDGAGNWLPNPVYLGDAYRTIAQPVLHAYKGKLYLAWLSTHLNSDHTHDVWFAYTENGTTWSAPVRQTVNEPYNFLRSPYPPAFSIFSDTFEIFWGSGPARGNAVYHGAVNLGSIIGYVAVHNGTWKTKIGNTLVYKAGQEWIFTTGLDAGIWEGTGSAFKTYRNLKHSPATAATSAIAGAAIVPGYPGKLGKPWRIFLLWKNQGNNNTLWESSVDL